MSDYGSINSSEYVYDQKNEGKVKLKRTLMIVGYVAYLLGFFIFCMATKIFALFAIGPLTLYIIYLLTWRLVSYDCYWEFATGALEIGRIKVSKNGRRKTPAVKIQIKDALRIGGFTDLSQLGNIDKLYDYSESPSSDKRVYIIFEDDGKRCCAIVEATARLLSLLATFSKNADPELKSMPNHG